MLDLDALAVDFGDVERSILRVVHEVREFEDVGSTPGADDFAVGIEFEKFVDFALGDDEVVAIEQDAEGIAEARPLRDEGAVRREAQRVLFDLAFFPNEDQCSIGRQLIHSEPTSDDSALWLITDAKKGLGNWISGLRSPWKGGYLRSNGGRSAAAIYCAAEWLSAHLPLGSKAAMRRLLALMLMGR